MSKKIALVSLVIILVLVNWSIAGKEKQLTSGKVVYLHLAPVDPRSLMQGDYMALGFRLADEVYKALPKTEDAKRWGHGVASSDGYVVVSLDKRGIGSFKGLCKDQVLSGDDMKMRYRVRNGAVKFATNAYFFQEGQGEYYQPARYGQFRVDDRGEVLLVALYDKDLKRLMPDGKE
ncbi:MAG: GDYXXLXY domain-containing protein [Proteobacteria bacterium]|nr:GDYXXLXY domain-containing protein [Pseudomonadota bacterium]